MSRKRTAARALLDSVKQTDSIANSLIRFQKAAAALSSHHPRLIDEYPDKWVAVCDHKVVAHGDSRESVLEQTDARGVDRADIIVRLIERNRRTLIL